MIVVRRCDRHGQPAAAGAKKFGEQLQSACNDSGRKMLTNLVAQVNSMPTNITNYGSAISAQIDTRAGKMPFLR